MLLAAPAPASLEVVNDANGFIANFWRSVKHQPAAVALAADYPVSHIDMGARHRWLMTQRDRLGAELQDPHWPGDAEIAGWWLWGQCSWIGSGWCEWSKSGEDCSAISPGQGIQAAGQIPHAGNPGRGIQAAGKIPHASDAGRGEQMRAQFLTSAGHAAWVWLHKLAARLERVRVVHGDWQRGLNHYYGGADTAVFLDPPYRGYEALYAAGAPSVADAVCEWARENADIRIALCGHIGDYDLPGWDAVPWKRKAHTYGGSDTTDKECIWYSPACLPALRVQRDLFEP
jgi:hypothetical protein